MNNALKLTKESHEELERLLLRKSQMEQNHAEELKTLNSEIMQRRAKLSVALSLVE